MRDILNTDNINFLLAVIVRFFDFLFNFFLKKFFEIILTSRWLFGLCLSCETPLVMQRILTVRIRYLHI
jgi:hypothetical protein